MILYNRTLSSRVKYVSCILLCLILFVSCNDTATGPDGITSLTVTLTFKGPVAKGNYYTGYLPKTDWSIWIKNASSQYIKTLKINTGIVKIGTYGAHAFHLPNWLSCTGDSIKDTPDADSIPDRFDGITSASILINASLPEETVTATWDFTDINGNTVSDGDYYFCAETANIQKDSANNVVGYTLAVFSETSNGSVSYPSGITT
ncbi:MAG: hypothetical protein L0Y76_11415, partial [Ignavibacteria bacterium]|nr:hypothetical protein [Ignavibacteria bacterium]